jgi:hypothetical protein
MDGQKVLQAFQDGRIGNSLCDKNKHPGGYGEYFLFRYHTKSSLGPFSPQTRISLYLHQLQLVDH